MGLLMSLTPCKFGWHQCQHPLFHSPSKKCQLSKNLPLWNWWQHLITNIWFSATSLLHVDVQSSWCFHTSRCVSDQWLSLLSMGHHNFSKYLLSPFDINDNALQDSYSPPYNQKFSMIGSSCWCVFFFVYFFFSRVVLTMLYTSNIHGISSI